MKPIKLKTQYSFGRLSGKGGAIEPLYYPADDIETIKKDIKDLIQTHQEICEEMKQPPNLLLAERYFVIYKVVPYQIMDTYEDWVDFYKKHCYKEVD